ncbi:hypothetical protein OB955_07570 [Halobacteria archaeon AArc-m2/3/4]|uniref:Uncharacterized protein n=1 Tax=Natronoglomus mannanivorans TaxID=2979990 RepID=A0ABT2QCE9_9EURY|nr:hypothetical protein [Halobacteria archaeon AArc-m2/3/4]
MGDFARGLVVPFFAALFPAVWYINRDVASEHHSPEPSTSNIVLSIVAALVGAVVIAVVGSLVVRALCRDADRPWLRRVLVPDRRSLAVYGVLILGLLGWSLTEMAGLGPSWLSAVLEPVFYLAAVPLLLLGPIAIHSYPAVVLGLALSAIWLSILSTVVAGVLERRLGSASEWGHRT